MSAVTSSGRPKTPNAWPIRSAPTPKKLPGDGIVRVVWRGDHPESNVRRCQQLFNAAHNPRVGIKSCCFVAAALHNRGKPQARNGINHRRVKGTPCQAKSDESDVDHSEVAAVKCRRRAYTISRATQLPWLRVKFASGGLLLQNV